MINLAKRNVKIFLRDPARVFFSCLSILITVAIYFLFLGNTLQTEQTPAAVVDAWMIAGIIAVSPLTVSTGTIGSMVLDKFTKIFRDFYISPLKRSEIVLSYIFSTVFICVSLSLIGFGAMVLLLETLAMADYLAILGLILLTSLASTAIMAFVASLFNSYAAYSAVGSVVGVLTGFLAGAFMPIGNFSETVRRIVFLFPISHAAALFRQIAVPNAEHIPLEYQIHLGLRLTFGDFVAEPWLNIVFLAGTLVVFGGLAVVSISRKGK